jgi:hypothetical protein
MFFADSVAGFLAGSRVEQLRRRRKLPLAGLEDAGHVHVG